MPGYFQSWPARPVARVAVDVVISIGEEGAAVGGVKPDGVIEHVGVTRPHSRIAAAGEQTGKISRYLRLIDQKSNARAMSRVDDRGMA